MLTMDDMPQIVKPHNDKIVAEARLDEAYRAIRELLALIDISKMETSSLPTNEYEATYHDAICGALRVLRGRP